MLKKTITIMTADKETSDELGFACFVADVDEGEPDRSVAMTYDLHDELGNPETITVTIEPGDQLNV